VTRAKGRRRGWPVLAVAATLMIAAAAALWIWNEPIQGLLGDQGRLRSWLARLGPLGPLATIGLSVAQVILAPIPGQFVGVMNGYLYGIAAGTLYTMVGLVLGTAAAMALARRYGRPLVERLVPEGQLTRWDGIADRQGPWFFFLVFLFPFVPDDINCLLIGLSPLSIPRMLVLATLGRLPGVFVSCWLGARTVAFPTWAWVALGGGAGTLAWLFWRYHEELEGSVLGLIRRLTGRQG